MQQVLIIVQILVAVGLIGLVLLQHGKGADAGAAFGSGTSGSIFGARGPASFLAKITAVLATVFFVNSVALSYIGSKTVDRSSVVERYQQTAGQETGGGAPAGTGASVPDPSAAIPEEQPQPAASEGTQSAPSAPAPGDVPAAPAEQ